MCSIFVPKVLQTGNPNRVVFDRMGRCTVAAQKKGIEPERHERIATATMTMIVAMINLPHLAARIGLEIDETVIGMIRELGLQIGIGAGMITNLTIAEVHDTVHQVQTCSSLYIHMPVFTVISSQS